MNSEEKVAHISGRYRITVAIIGLLGVIIGVYLTFYFTSKNELNKLEYSDSITDTLASDHKFEEVEIKEKPNKNESPTIKETKEIDRIIKLRIVVDSKYSNGTIEVNGKNIPPLPESTLTVKVVEINCSTDIINLIVKSKYENSTCKKSISLNKNYFDNPQIIEVTCLD